jgi:hypothetical protein
VLELREKPYRLIAIGGAALRLQPYPAGESSFRAWYLLQS